MKIRKSLELKTRKAVLESILVLLEKNTCKNIPKIFKLSKLLVNEDLSIEIINTIERHYNNMPAMKTYINNCVANINPQILKKIVLNSLLYKNDDSNYNMPLFLMLEPNYKNSALSFKEVDKIIGEAQNLGITCTCIISGEPFYYDFLYNIYNKYNNMNFLVFTNGKMFNHDICSKILSLGNIIPIIFLDGSKSFTDNNYGLNTFDSIINGMKLLKSNKIPFGIFSTVLDDNIDMITDDKFIDMLIKNGSILSIYSLSLGQKNYNRKLICENDYQEFSRKINSLRMSKPYFFINLFDDIDYIYKSINKITPKNNNESDICIFTNISSRNIKKMPLNYFNLEN